MKEELEEAAEKVDLFLQKKEFGLEECYIISKSLMESYWDQIIDQENSSSDDDEEDDFDNEDDAGESSEQDDFNEEDDDDLNYEDDMVDLDDVQFEDEIEEDQDDTPRRGSESKKTENNDQKREKVRERISANQIRKKTLPPKPLIKKPTMKIIN